MSSCEEGAWWADRDELARRAGGALAGPTGPTLGETGFAASIQKGKTAAPIPVPVRAAPGLR